MSDQPTTENPFDSIESAIADIASGKMVIVTDDESRENEGDLVMAASKVTPQAINQMILHARGLICVPMLSHQLRRLGINPMASENRESHQTDFAISGRCRRKASPRASAPTTEPRRSESSATRKQEPDMLVQPGHVFPLRAKPGGVLQRAGTY
jgi:3,4-dihydroxy 2-butanone 4-phosphate synthase/GTP cyclohydrolase II